MISIAGGDMTTDKYASLLDDEIHAFIERSDFLYSADAGEDTIEHHRAIYEEMARVFHAGYPENVSASDDAIETGGRSIPVRRYHAEGSTPVAQVVYFHGGGFVVGGLDSHDSICAEICAATGYPLVSVDYRLAPENIHPASFDDALAAFEHVAGTSSLPVVLAGDSAGGNLAACVAGACREGDNQPIGQVLIYPVLGGDCKTGSYAEHAHAPMLTTDDIGSYDRTRSGGDPPTDDPTFEPLKARDFSRLPPTVVISAQCDPLSDDGRDYRDRILASGGKAVWFNEPGLVHGYMRARHMSQRARESFDRITEAVAVLGRREWIY
jgi:acetyl esterase